MAGRGASRWKGADRWLYPPMNVRRDEASTPRRQVEDQQLRLRRELLRLILKNETQRKILERRA